MEKIEAHIIREILDGRTDRYEYFVATYSQRVFALIAGIVTCREDAEELTQDVFLKAFRHLSSFKEESNFSTWIYRIAYNTALTAVRKRRFDVCPMDDKMLANLSDKEVDDALAGETEEQLRQLEAALMKLDAEERTLITLHYMEEKPLKEVAFVLGMTEGNAKVKLHRIRKKLCVLIKQKDHE